MASRPQGLLSWCERLRHRPRDRQMDLAFGPLASWVVWGCMRLASGWAAVMPEQSSCWLKVLWGVKAPMVLFMHLSVVKQKTFGWVSWTIWALTGLKLFTCIWVFLPSNSEQFIHRQWIQFFSPLTCTAVMFSAWSTWTGIQVWHLFTLLRNKNSGAIS